MDAAAIRDAIIFQSAFIVYILISWHQAFEHDQIVIVLPIFASVWKTLQYLNGPTLIILRNLNVVQMRACVRACVGLSIYLS